ncbi:MAG: sialidase family protein, partial [Fimbriimonadaceae bacterium]
AKGPQVAIVGGQVYVAFGMGDALYLSTSSDNGLTYSEPIKVGESGKLSLGMRRGPRIGVHKGVVTITAIYGDQGRGRDGDIVAFRSADKGKTWSEPVKVNDVAGSGREGLHAMAIAPDGTLVCTWLDLRDKGTKLFMSVSKDGGAAWSKNQLVYDSPSGTICECCHPSLAFDAKGKLVVMFRNSLDGARDMYITESTDLKTFSPAVKLGEDSWMINACPMDGGMVSVEPNGAIQSIWRRDKKVFRSSAAEDEQSLGEGSNPWMATGAGGSYFTWQIGAAVYVLTPKAGSSMLSGKGVDPVVSASEDGALVVAAWTGNGIWATRLR